MQTKEVRDLREEDSPGLRAVLYEADGRDRTVDLDDVDVAGLGDDHLLWVDVAIDGHDELDTVASRLDLDERSIERITGNRERPRLEQFDAYFHVNIHAVKEGNERFDPIEIHCLVGDNWVVTAHSDTFDLLGEFNEPIKGETKLGRLTGGVFLAQLLDWLLNGYFHALEDLEGQVDELDERLLVKNVDQDELLQDLIRMRRRITALRGMAAPHRDVVSILMQPGFADSSEEATENFRRLYDRLESAVDGLERAREMVMGSFEVFMTQTAQRTNDVMRTLTLVSVLLLPAVVLAGIMGMNFRVGFFDNPDWFWFTLAIMVVLAGITLLIAHRKRWI